MDKKKSNGFKVSYTDEDMAATQEMLALMQELESQFLLMNNMNSHRDMEQDEKISEMWASLEELKQDFFKEQENNEEFRNKITSKIDHVSDDVANKITDYMLEKEKQANELKAQIQLKREDTKQYAIKKIIDKIIYVAGILLLGLLSAGGIMEVLK